MFLLGFEIIGMCCNKNNTNTSNYQPPPRYEDNSNTGRHNNLNQDPPPSYSE